jgi:carboxymethylenebutenolidase
MKYILLLITVLSIQVIAKAQPSCCIKATDDFAALGNNKAFRMEHKEPLPFVYESLKGKDINYQAKDGSTAHAFEVKADKQTPYYIFVIHEWWGLNDFVKQESEKLANDLGVNVLALDLYDNKVATTREDAVTYMQGVTNDRALDIINGAFTYAGSNAKVFTVGWCFGGGWSLQTALAGGNQVQGCVMYYGMPERDVNRLKNLQCDVIGFFAKKDQNINPEVVKSFEQSMKDAGKSVTVYEYDAQHGFANPSNPIFDKAARDDAYAKQTAFIKARMK